MVNLFGLMKNPEVLEKIRYTWNDGAKVHVEELLPKICSIDCGSFNYAEGDYVYISTPNMLEKG